MPGQVEPSRRTQRGRAWLSGFVVRAASPRVSNGRATASLDEYLRAQGVVVRTVEVQ